MANKKSDVDVIKEMYAFLHKTFINENGRFTPSDISIEAATEMLHVAKLAGRLGGMAIKRQVKKGDVVFVKWSDEWEYPLVVRSVGPRNIKATYVYEDGRLETWTVGINTLTSIVAASSKDIIADLQKYVDQNEFVAMPENKEQFLLEVKLNR